MAKILSTVPLSCAEAGLEHIIMSSKKVPVIFIAKELDILVEQPKDTKSLRYPDGQFSKFWAILPGRFNFGRNGESCWIAGILTGMRISCK